MLYKNIFAATICSAFLAPCAFAEGEPETLSDPSRWGVGVGVATLSEAYSGIDDDIIVLPLLIHESRWISISGPVLDLKLGKLDSFSFRIRARFEPGAGYEAGDSAELSGMDDRKAGIWVGAATLWQTSILDIGLEWLADASGYSEGQRATLNLQRRFALRKFSFTPRAEVIWLDRENATYYYGVEAHEARPGRAFHELDGTVNYKLGLRAEYLIANRQTLIIDLSATRLGGEIADSPIVDRSSASAVFLGYAYVF